MTMVQLHVAGTVEHICDCGANSNTVGARLLKGGGGGHAPQRFFKTNALGKAKNASQCTRRSVLIYL